MSTLVISSQGLNPSNRNAGFPNLARQQNPPQDIIDEVTKIATAELRAAGIHPSRFPLSNGEVPARVIGSLSMWTFQRRWYYWSAEGPGLPVDVAERLHEAHGQQVRVDGHCGCPSPREWFKGFGVGSYHIDSPEGLKALAEAILSVYDPDKDPTATPHHGKRETA